MMRRRPIARTVARTAVVAGTATVVAGGVARRQAARNEPQAQQVEQPAPVEAAADPAGSDPVARLTQLASLKDQGILTEEEFAAKKAEILNEM